MFSSTRRLIAPFLLFLFASQSCWSKDEAKQVTLSKSQQITLVEKVLPAWQQGNSLALLQSLSSLVAKMDEDQIGVLDKSLDEEGLPSAGEVLAHARMLLIEHNLTASLPRPKGRELLLSLEAMIKRVEKELDKVTTHPALEEKKPKIVNLREYEGLFWHYHVLDNRLLTAGRFAKYAQDLSAAAKKLNTKHLTDAQRAVLASDLGDLEQRIVDGRKKLAIADFEARVARLSLASETLAGPNNLTEKFLAAFFLDLDSEYLSQQLGVPDLANGPGLQQGKDTLAPDEDSKAINSVEPNPFAAMSEAEKSYLIENVRQDISIGRKAAGEDLIRKSRLLFTGLHWWYRGRYGASSEGNGLLKPKEAMSSPQAMFTLYMPTETPVPSESRRTPRVDRRHHYLWQFETRTISTSDKTYSSSYSTPEINRTTTTTFDQFI